MQIMDKKCKLFHVLHSRGKLEPRVQVHARPAGMGEAAEDFQAVRPDAAAEEERRVAFVLPEDFPVELLSASAYCRAGGVEKEIIANAFILFGGREGLFRRDAESLDDFHVPSFCPEGFSELSAETGCLLPV